MKYRWIIPPVTDDPTVQKLAETINVSPTIARILASRGVTSFELAKQFFRPSLNDLHDPFLMDGMEAAVNRSLQALEQGEKIAIYGDYDVDGTNSAAMLHLFFKEMGADVDFYLPDRFTEGYGISTIGIDRLKQRGFNLIITIDCGITAVDQIAYANSLGFDVIICDHHEAADTIPPALAVLDPIKPGCNYPFKYLSGCGVGFKMIQAIAMRLGQPDVVHQYLDFVAIAAAADIVPLTGENRSLVSHGLRKLNETPRPGFRGLLECAGIKTGNLGTSQIVFGIAPRINAAGRLGDARRAVEMLIEEDEIRAFQRAQELESDNRNRRAIDEETFAEARVIAEKLIADNDECRALVIHNADWHPGVIGIVASRLVERYYLPTVLLTTVEGIAKGSARSIAGFDIYSALKHCEEHIEQFGGHKYAAGLSIREENIDCLRTALESFAGDEVSDYMLTPELLIDAQVTLEEVTPRFFNIIKQFAPFGPGNARPLFLMRNASIVGYPRVVGKDHLKFRVRDGNGYVEAISFGSGGRLEELNGRDRYDLVFNLEENEYRGNVTQQLRVIDFRVASQEGSSIGESRPASVSAEADAPNADEQPPVTRNTAA